MDAGPTAGRHAHETARAAIAATSPTILRDRNDRGYELLNIGHIAEYSTLHLRRGDDQGASADYGTRHPSCKNERMSGIGSDYNLVAAEIGLAALRTLDPALTGTGISVGQVEASVIVGATDFEPVPGALGFQPDNAGQFFTFYSGHLHTTTPNDGTVGDSSTHATMVGSYFYGAATFDGAPEGIAPGVAHVDAYFADDVTSDVANLATDQVVNMSYVDTSGFSFDTTLDTLANTDNIVFVAAAGNSGTPLSPSTAYNAISVDSSTALDAIGPATNGVPKPDISAPEDLTSFATPIVSGAATLLIQAATDGMGGAGTEADAANFRTIKTLLLNSAVKPADYFTDAYAPTAAHPLNARYGAGVVNILDAVLALDAGEHAASAHAIAASGTYVFANPAVPALGAEGWNLATLVASAGSDAMDIYALSLGAGQSLAATLSWAADNANSIDAMGLALYAASGTRLAGSDVAASNVQQINVADTTSGTYDLVVTLHGGATTLTDPYAIAWGPEQIACFAGGTRILTPSGSRAVETLLAGECVVTASGRIARLLWVGHRRLNLRHRLHARPIRVRAGALAHGVPADDLLLSPDHAVLVGGCLVPVRHLVNALSVVAERMDTVTYFHLELDRHDLLLAEGAACESYLDTGNRAAFENGRDPLLPRPDALAAWQGGACLKLETGADNSFVLAAWQQLLTRAEMADSNEWGVASAA